MPYECEYAQKIIDEYIEMGVDPKDVWPQSFNVDDVKYRVDKPTLVNKMFSLATTIIYPKVTLCT